MKVVLLTKAKAFVHECNVPSFKQYEAEIMVWGGRMFKLDAIHDDGSRSFIEVLPWFI